MKKLEYLMKLEALETGLRKLEVSASMVKAKAEEKELKEARKTASKKVAEAIKHLKSVESNIWEAVDGIEKPKFKFVSKMPVGASPIYVPKKLVDSLDNYSDVLGVMSENESYAVIIGLSKIKLTKQKSLTLLKKASTALDVASETISDLLK